MIMLSARAGEEARIEGLAASADDYLVKPFSARDLLARVDVQLVKGRVRAIEQRHAQRSDAALHARPGRRSRCCRGPTHVFELTNPRYHELIGGRDVVGKPIREALPELDGQGVVEILDRVRSSGEPFVGPVGPRRPQSRRSTERPRTATSTSSISRSSARTASVETIVVIAHDVTALAAAKHEAETANRLKDEFLATLSHELRTPLNAVLGYTQMVRGGVIEPQRLPAVLETIERNARLQEQLISDVLDVSRIITGKLRLDIAARRPDARDPGGARDRRRRRRRRRASGCRPPSISPACRWPATRSGCSRSSGTCCRTRSSSRRAADACRFG